SCGRREEEADTYLGEIVDLNLSENETILDIIEVDGELRATVGVTSEEMAAKYGTEYDTPYKTEYRYYDLEFVEDADKREPTASFYQIGQASDPALGLTIGGEPYLYTDANGAETSYGVRYKLYKDGEPVGDVLNPKGASNYGKCTEYGASANVMMLEDTPYVWLDYKDYTFELYVKDRFVKSTELSSDISHAICGLMNLGGTPYALTCAAQYDYSEYGSMEEPIWEKTFLLPLNPETSELSLEGIEIEGVPTGGAFSDGTYGYYMCGSELWRTDGETSQRISELIFCGVNGTSMVRAIRPLSDGRILMVANGGLIELVQSDTSVPANQEVYVIGLMKGGHIDYVSLTAAQFNGAGKGYRFVVKEYKDVTKLNLALLSGEVDIIATADLFSLRNYVKQGLLAPLEEVVPEFFEEGVLIENVVDATRVDGVCYYLPREFDLMGRAIECRLLEEGQTFETPLEYIDFVREKDPGYLEWATKDLILSHIVPNFDEWIDWENNSCHFDDGTFKVTLEFCNKGATFETWNPEALTYTRLEQIMGGIRYPYFENLFIDVASARAYLSEKAGVNLEKLPESTGEVRAEVIMPFPSSVHDGYEIWAEQYFAVVDKEASREATAEFMKWHFLEDVVGEIAPDDPEADHMDFDLKGMYRFSINLAETERYVGRNLTWDGADKETRLPVEQRWYEDTWKMIRQADHLAYYRNAVYDVVMEEAYRYFKGEITAKQAAEYVQNRISLYLAEQG
ncbi:MAG: hypothetical protein IKU11_03740, partial [Clostridia bacterium]|nr:hypothetical protein [Clostridia bacterium]